MTTSQLSLTTAAASILAGNVVGGIDFRSNDNNGIFTAAKIQAIADASHNVGAGLVSTSLVFSNNTERMRIDSAGNVGIGDNDPDTKLSIKKSIDATTYDSGTRMIDFKSYFPGYDETGIKASIYSGVSDIASLNTNKGYLAFLINNGSSGTSLDERMRILPTGGITFNGDTAQANALDDYEEGTFTPTLTLSLIHISEPTRPY